MIKNSKVDKIYIHKGDKIKGIDVVFNRCNLPYIYPAYNDENRTYSLYKNITGSSMVRIEHLINNWGGFICKVHLFPSMICVTGYTF